MVLSCIIGHSEGIGKYSFFFILQGLDQKVSMTNYICNKKEKKLRKFFSFSLEPNSVDFNFWNTPIIIFRGIFLDFFNAWFSFQWFVCTMLEKNSLCENPKTFCLKFNKFSFLAYKAYSCGGQHLNRVWTQ